MNIFEGSRRISYLLLGLGVFLSAAANYKQSPYVHYGTFLVSPGKVMERVAECPTAEWTNTRVTYPSAYVNITLCTPNGPSELGFPPDEMKGVEAAVAKQKRDDMLAAAGYTVLGAAIWLAFVKCIGWIVRGFLSIPPGRDSKPT